MQGEDFIKTNGSEQTTKQTVGKEVASSYCDFMAVSKALPGGGVQNDSPQVLFRDSTAGDILNIYEKFVINSKWDVRDSKSSTSILLGRNNYFYEIFENYETKVDMAIENSNLKLKVEIQEQYDDKNIYNLISRATDLVANKLNLTHNYDAATIALTTTKESRISKRYRNEDVSMIDTLNRVGVRKFSENHFVVSGANLIYSEISVNEETINTTSMTHDQLFDDDNFIITVLPVSNSKNYFGEQIREKVIASPAGHLDGETHNMIRVLEYLSNSLFKELEYMYSGKIFCKYIEDLQIGDTITLIDDVSSTVGKFRVDTFEHVLDAQGFRTIVNVKACLDLVDPVLDLYNAEITLGLFEDLALEIERNQKNEIGINNYIKTIYDYYGKILLQGKRYCKFYHKRDKGMFDSEEYPKAYDNALANPMNIRVYPIVRKGKELFPASLKTVFYNLIPEEPEHGLIENMYKNLRKNVKLTFQKLGNWATDSLVYIGDFLISIPTFGFHELLKAPLGMTFKKAIENTYGENTTDLDNEQMGILLTNSDYDNWSVEDADRLTIGFFNVQAQKKENLIPEIKDDDYFKRLQNKSYYDKEVFKNRRVEKETIVKKIIDDAFDVALVVELYDGFKDEGYSIDDFIRNITSNDFNMTSKEVIFNNRYGNEYGAVFERRGKTIDENIKTTPIFLLDGRQIPEGNRYIHERKRSFLETSLDVSQYNYGIDTLKIIWFHNIYGSDSLQENLRIKNARSVLDRYNEELSKNKKLGVIIMADFNLEIFNDKSQPIDDRGSNYQLLPHDLFKNRIKKQTTLNSQGDVSSNLYDNVLVSHNLSPEKIGHDSIRVQRFVYPYANKKIISDHVPVYISLKKKQ